MAPPSRSAPGQRERGFFVLGNGNSAHRLDRADCLNTNAFIDTGANAFLNGVVSGPGALTVTSGGSSLVLNNLNTYTGVPSWPAACFRPARRRLHGGVTFEAGR